MTLTLDEIKDLLAYGRELGLQQLQTEGLVAIYGQAAIVAPPIGLQLSPDSPDQSDTENILAHYSAAGRRALNKGGA